MKITKSQLRKIIKEEFLKEAGLPHSMRSGRSMGDLDREAKMRETDFLAKKSTSFAMGTVFKEQEKMLELLTVEFNVMEEQAPAFLRQMADDLEGKE